MSGKRGESVQAGVIRITSPENGAVVLAGETVLVSVEVTPGTVLQRATAMVIPLSVEPQYVDQPPFEIPTRIPDKQIGPTTLLVLAKDQNGEPLQASITVLIEQRETIRAIAVQPERMDFLHIGAGGSINVFAMFDNTPPRTITPLARLVSNNTSVVAVGDDGHIQAAGLGVASIVVSYGEFTEVIPVTVGRSEIQADLDGDLDIDGEDLALLLLGVGTQSTGAGDPRDLNGDGSINNLDADLLRAKCTRGDCATEQLVPILFRRGDANGDGELDISDPVFSLFALFTGQGQAACPDAADADDNGKLQITDPLYTLNYLFRGGPAPPDPGPNPCGPDPSDDTLSACTYDVGRC